MKFKELIKKILDIPKELFKRFPCSISLSILLSLVLALFLESDFMEDIIVFILVFPVGILFSEIYFEKNKSYKTAGFILSLITAIVSNKTILEENDLAIKLTIVYVVILVILGLIKLLKDSKLSLEEFITRIVSNLFKIHIIFSVLSTGMLLISLIIMSLFLKGNITDTIIVRLELLVSGIYYIPALIYSFTDTKNKPWDFISFIIKNIASVIVILAFLIIYIYLIKILILLKIPSNSLFRITGILFVLGLPIWTMVLSYDKDNILVKICSKLPYAFIPFIFLQIYSLMVRINANGITIIRYIGILLIILEIIYIILYIFKRDKLYYLGYVIIIFVIVGLLIPKINAVDVSINSQYKRLHSYLNKTKLSKDDHSSLENIYYYLDRFEKGEELLSSLTKEQKDYILNNPIMDYKCYEEYYSSLTNLEVTGYKTISEFDIHGYEEEQSIELFKNISIFEHEVNMYPYIKDFIKNKDYNEDLKTTTAIVGDNYKIEITDIRICIEDSTVEDYNISGYILEK